MQKNILIIGAGIAGCSLAYFLALRGWQVTLLESKDDIAQGASGNPVAAIYPKSQSPYVVLTPFTSPLNWPVTVPETLPTTLPVTDPVT